MAIPIPASPKTYMLENGIIDCYFQKSYRFIYPLLQISLDHKIFPVQTYLSWADNIVINEFKLICVFAQTDEPAYKAFERKILQRHDYFEDYRECEGNKGVYIFNLKTFKEDILLLFQSKYAQFSDPVKAILLKYYAVNKYSREYMDSFLNPENYYAIYAKHLNVEEKLLKEVGQLCERFEREKEHLILNVLAPKFTI